MLKIAHVIITRFSCRVVHGRMNVQVTGKKVVDPLNPYLLSLRTKIFEFTALPSILSQTNQNFSWVLIVDKDLPQQDRLRLQMLIKLKDRAYLHEYNSTDDPLESCEWLKPYIPTVSDYLLTTNHDDDDVLPTNFVNVVHNHLTECYQKNGLPPLKTLGCKQALQWDIVTSHRAPLGLVSGWTREEKVLSCGASLLCKYPDYPVNVLKVPHACTENCLDWNSPPQNMKTIKARESFRRLAKQNNDSLEGFSTRETFFDTSKETGPVLMSNHTLNLQTTRLFEKKPESVPVTGPESFINLPVDFNRFQEYIASFKKDSYYFERFSQSVYPLHIEPLLRKSEKAKRSILRKIKHATKSISCTGLFRTR